MKEVEIEVEISRRQAEKITILADAEAKKEIRLAEARKEALNLIGQGLALKVQQMASVGVSIDQVMEYLRDELKWLNIGDKTVVIDSSGGIPGIIAQLKTLGNTILNTGGTV